ncbi:MAG TPA: NUDIX domain-containing protein [Ilumatobacteraceae bacterium]
MAGNDALLQHLENYAPRTAAEADDVRTVVALASHDAAAWARSSPVHVTGSALIVHPPSRRVLLRWHVRQNGWLQVGGHADPGERDPLSVALREGAEETGLSDLRPWPTAALQHVVIVNVPASDREPAHQHADLRFLLATDQPDATRPETDSAPLRWLTVDEALLLAGEDNVCDVIRIAGELFD